MPDEKEKEFVDEAGPMELGVIDLHGFRPKDVKDVVLDYLELCHENGVCEVRIIHGKGIGQLRNTVRSILSKHPRVTYFALATEAYGGAGATIARLKPKSAGD